MDLATTSTVRAVGQKLTSLGSRFQLPSWILVWFYATAVICTWDATFIMLRPYTLPGGSLAGFWYLYKYYVSVDQRYKDTKDAYVFAQSLLNYAEVVFNIVTIVMHYAQSRHTATTAFTVSVMTFWKTVLYFLMFSEFCTGGEYRQGNTALEEIALVVIPNVIWVIVPLYVMYSLWDQLTPSGQASVKTALTSNGKQMGTSHVTYSSYMTHTTAHENGVETRKAK
ncbi:uncharacterized protein LOC131932435 [Physella acuta]|uniref:uncharacterized protein LOC131932435 n=1 Tax=Physella acuta TaxID=109671 RepID=UPI0027DDA51E|nr:uncharacterized protein LOC131932435 [Physella acuta]